MVTSNRWLCIMKKIWRINYIKWYKQPVWKRERMIVLFELNQFFEMIFFFFLVLKVVEVELGDSVRTFWLSRIWSCVIFMIFLENCFNFSLPSPESLAKMFVFFYNHCYEATRVWDSIFDSVESLISSLL